MSNKDISKKEMEHLAQFHKADTDNNMFISEEELKSSLQQFGLKSGRVYKPEEIAERMKFFDVNNDGFISQEEFVFKMKQMN